MSCIFERFNAYGNVLGPLFFSLLGLQRLFKDPGLDNFQFFSSERPEDGLRDVKVVGPAIHVDHGLVVLAILLLGLLHKASMLFFFLLLFLELVQAHECGPLTHTRQT